MTVQWQELPIPLGGGIDTKTDPKLVRPPSLLDLQNGVFTENNSVKKRLGYNRLADDVSAVALATRQNELLALDGKSLHTYAESANTWVNRGTHAGVCINYREESSRSVGQVQPQSAVLKNTRITAWVTSTGDLNYKVSDESTGATIQSEISITDGSNAKFVILGDFVHLYYTDNAATSLRVRVISAADPTAFVFDKEIASDVNTTLVYDVICINEGTALVVYDNDFSQKQVTALFVDRNGDIASGTTTYGVFPAPADIGLIGISADIDDIAISAGDTYFWISYILSGDTSGPYVRPLLLTDFSDGGNTIQPFDDLSAGAVEDLSIESTAISVIVTNESGSEATILANIPDAPQTPLGSVNLPDVMGSASFSTNGTTTTAASYTFVWDSQFVSRPFSHDGIEYIVTHHQSTLQNTYFLTRVDTGEHVGRFFEGIAGTASDYSFPVTVHNPSPGVFNFAVTYRRRLTLAAAEEDRDPTEGFTDSGIRVVTLDFTDQRVYSYVEHGDSLYLGGGFVWEYDGVNLYEQGIHLFPEDCVFEESDWVNRGDWTISTSYSVDDVVTSTTDGFRYICTVAGTSGGDDSDLAGGSDTGVTWVAFNPFQYVYRVYYESVNENGERTRSTGIPYSVEMKNEIGVGNSPTIYLPLLFHTLRNNISIVVYRSEANTDVIGGAPLYRVSSPSPGVTGANGYITNEQTTPSLYAYTFTDELVDEFLINNEIDYLSSGELDNTPAPSSCIIASGKNRIWLAGTDGPNRVSFSKLTIPGESLAFSDANIIDMPDDGGDVVALEEMNTNMIVFKETSIYAITGEGPNNLGFGSGNFGVQLITTDVGCIDARSVVKVPRGIMFQSAKGIYLLMQNFFVQYVGDRAEAYNNQTVTGANIVPDTNQVRFLTNAGRTLMYDYFRDEWSTFTNHEGTSSVVWKDQYTYCRNSGQVFVRAENSYTDAGIGYKLKFKLPWLRLRYFQNFMRIKWLHLLGDYKSAHTLRYKVRYDFESPSDTGTEDPTEWYNLDAYGSGTYGSGTYGGTGSTLYQIRIDLARQKCTAIQFEFEDITTEPGEAYELTGLVVKAGAKVGPNKLELNRKSSPTGKSTVVAGNN